MNDNKDKAWMSDLESVLADDADGRRLREQQNAFNQYAQDLTRSMGMGMDKRDLLTHMEMKKAADISVTLLENIWRKLRSKSR